MKARHGSKQAWEAVAVDTAAAVALAVAAADSKD